MVPKPVFTRFKAKIRELRKEHESETVGKSGLLAVPVEVGRQLVDFLRNEHVKEEAAKECCEYCVKQGLLAHHPWGGFMIPLHKDAPPIPPMSEAPELVEKAIEETAKERMS